MATVSLCMIVRNEQRHLPACLACCGDLVDEIVIVDTGSTDKTKEIAAAARDKHGRPAKVFDFAWCDDFSAARNESLRHATSDWIFWMDADDRLTPDNRQRFAAFLESLSATSIYYLFGVLSLGAKQIEDTHAIHVRVFPNRAGIHWLGRIHEQPQFPAGMRMAPAGVVVTHVGQLDDDRYEEKRRRNLRLLLMEYAERPNNVDTLYYLGTEYAGTQPATAITYLETARRRIEAAKLSPNYFPELFCLSAWCYAQLDRWREFYDAEAALAALGTEKSRLVMRQLAAAIPLEFRKADPRAETDFC